jgi:hypothetical protein
MPHAAPVLLPTRPATRDMLSYGHFEVAGLPRPLLQHPITTTIGTFFPTSTGPSSGSSTSAAGS